MAGKMKTKTLVKGFPVSKLKPYERNPRINKKAVDAVAKSIQRVGNNDPIEVNEKYVILCGHTRKLALEKLGIKTTDILVLSGLTEKQQKEYRITNNKTGELAEWDFEILEADFSADDLIEFGFDIKDLTQPEVVEDEAPPVPKKARTVRGDIYTLGNHRVMCGDSTMIDEVEKLMDGKKADMVFTDPPYGINVVQGNQVGGGGPTKFGKIDGGNIVKSKTYNKIIGDETTNTAKMFYENCMAMGLKNIVLWGGNYFTDFLKPSRCWFVWDKEMTGNFSQAEMAWTSFEIGGVRVFKYLWNGLSRKGSRDVELKTRVHPTQKPVGLFGMIFQKFDFIKSILDGFMGSGSTLIACEQTNRTCYGMELDEKYCDVIVQRWVNFTGGDVILNGKKIKWGKTDGRKD